MIRGALLVSGAGMLAGVAGAIALRRSVEARLYGVTGLDPATMGVACVTLMALALVASLVPALRAARVGPVTSLRVE